MPKFRTLTRLVALALGLGGLVAHAQTTSRIENTASLSYATGAGVQRVASNTVSVDVDRTKRPTSLSFRLLPLGNPLAGLDCKTSPSVVGVGAPIDDATLASAAPLASLDISQPLIMVLDDQAGNHDPLVRETAFINADAGDTHQRVQLTETAPNSGIFAGGFPAQTNTPDGSPCDLHLRRGDMLVLSFTENDFSFSSTASILIDPAGFVFDSSTGDEVDGALVTLYDESGKPATVFGDDGVSAYPSTVTSGASVTDASGRVYPSRKGRYRFPLTAPGRYYIKVVPPGQYTAPSTVDRGVLAAYKDSNGFGFMINDASFGGIFTLATVDPFFTDIPIDPPSNAALLLTKTASVRQASPGDFVQYLLRVTNRGTDTARGLHMADVLPTGLRYERGSTRGGDEPTVASDARSLNFALPPLAGGATTELRYVVTIAPGAPVGEALNHAQITGAGSLVSNEAMASVRIQPLLFTDAMTIIGRVTEGNCGDPVDHRKGIAGIRLLMEDGTFVVTDRDGLYHFEGVRAGRHVVQLDKAGIPANYEPVACDTDTRQAGSSISRFVEGDGGLLKRVDFQLRPTGRTASATQLLPIKVIDDPEAAGNRDWLAGQKPGVEWLFPQVDHNPRAPVLRVVIKHMPGQRVALTVNGKVTDPLAFDGTDGDGDSGVAISKWTGLRLGDGDNRLQARVLAADGSVVQTLDRTVHYSGNGVRAMFDAANSRLVADGYTRPLIAVRVTDKDGRPVRAGTLVPFKVDQPYTAAIDVALDQARQLAGRERASATVPVVGDDGLAFIALQPTTQAGAAHVTVSLTDDKITRTSETRAWLAASVKDWVVVGFGAGTLGYDMLNRHRNALPALERNKVVTDGQLAFYAKGRVKGSWLLTIAYDSNHKYDPDRGLLGTIDPDRYYTVYGDGSRQGYDAATRRKLYLRLERREFYALFGDYETSFTETQLGRYDRTLNGVKAAYEGRHIRATGFAAHTDTLFSRDEIQGNGLSGPYRLSGRNIVPNSDKLVIEVRDRFRSELIISSTALTRHIDYDIDITLGTIRFREPVLTRDANLNPIFIVADYEVEGGKSAKLAAGGRVVASLAKGRVEVGATALRDETIGKGTLIATDIKAKIGRSTELRGEVAKGGRNGLSDGIAYLAEAEHHGTGLDLLVYARRQAADFGVGQQNIVEGGTQKLGFDGRLKLTDRLTLTGTAWYQDMLTTPGQRLAGDIRLEYRRDTGTIFVGGQFAADRGLDGGDRDSRLLTLGGTQQLFGGKLVLGGQTQFAPGGDKGSVDFPIRHQVTASYRITKGIRLIGGYEIADGTDFTAHTARFGVDVAPWTGAKLMTTLNQQAVGENGQRTYAQYGLSQSIPIGKRWTIDATIDASNTLKGKIPTGAVINAFQPIASGGSLSGGSVGQDQINGNYVATTLGGTFRAARWSWNGRLEYRTSDAGDRWGVTSNFLRTLGEGKTLASSLRIFNAKDEKGAVANFASADVALAWRPLDSRWSVLERLEFRHERADAGISDANVLGVSAYNSSAQQVTTRLINNLALNYRTGAEGQGHGFEGTVYYGAKYVKGEFGDDVYTGYIDVTGFELRKDLGSKFDVGVQGSVQHAWDRGAFSWSGGPSAGVSPAPNVWVTAGYNISGYRDRDFEDDRYTRQGPYVTMRLKFDQTSIAGATRALFGRGR